MQPPTDSKTWVGLSEKALPIQEASQWVIDPTCGASVTFNGVARDHSSGRQNVTLLEYEAYEEQVIPRLQAIAEKARDLWPDVERVALFHRNWELKMGD